MALDDIQRIQRDFADRVEREVDHVMKVTGEFFVRDGRKVNTYRDVTTALRNSIGYGIKENGNITQQLTQGGEGGQAAEAAIAEAEDDEKTLVLVAGMGYAAAVEARGYDVISGSVEVAKRNFDKLMKAQLKRLAK